MRSGAERQIEAAAPVAREAGDRLTDDRFRRLVPRADWDALPADVRRRFSKRLCGTAVATYSGEIIWTRLSRIGWLLAQFCRLIGAPLPTNASGPMPAAVTVSEDRTSGGQCWTRLYGRTHGHPQVIHSAKSFAGPTGLEEHIGGGFGMADLAADEIFPQEHGAEKDVGDGAVVEGPDTGGAEDGRQRHQRVERQEDRPGAGGGAAVAAEGWRRGLAHAQGDALGDRRAAWEQRLGEDAQDDQHHGQGIEPEETAAVERVDQPDQARRRDHAQNDGKGLSHWQPFRWRLRDRLASGPA